MDSRRKFEAYAEREGLMLHLLADGEYDHDTLIAWKAWQASCESLVVELPEVHRDVTFDDESIDLMWPDEVIKAIHEAGIRTK